ncbi:MAG: pentapeptide repeat-containing protein [Deltaproteobacteria bacterium]|nr:pentapeptide repeat-containing protein [Deltaproteobacteria bacterium]
MKTRKFVQSPLLASLQPTRFGGRPFLAVTAFLGFNLDGAPGLLSPADAFGASAKALAPVLDQGVVFDLGLPKPRGEFLAAGNAYAPPEAARTGSVAASLRVGQLYREFLAIGEAPQLGPAPGDPAPFRQLPLDWARTARSAINPRGQVRGETLTSYGAVLGYPQVTDRRESGGALKADWPPAASPLPEPFGSKVAGSGTYDRDWLLGAWPGFPADFDLNALNMAQGAQILPEGHFAGNEAVSVLGMHPLRRELKSRLPGLAPRMVIAKFPPGVDPPEPPEISPGPDAPMPEPAAPPESLLFEEPALALDTVWLFPLFGAGIMIWHGSLGLEDAAGGNVWGLAAALATPGQGAEGPRELFFKGVEGFPDLPTLLPFDPVQAPTPEPAPTAPVVSVMSVAPPTIPAIPAMPAPAPEIPETPPAPTATVAAALAPAVPQSADALLDEARKSLREDLPEINRMLGEHGLRPLTQADLDESLNRYDAGLRQAYAENDRIDAEDAAKAAMSPEEREAAEEATIVADLVRGGSTPEEAADLLKAWKLPVPLESQFATAEEFEKALSGYGSEWARLTGMPGESGKLIADRLKAASLMEKDPAAGVEAFLAQTLGKDKAAALAKELAADVPAPAIAGPEELADELMKGGIFGKEEAAALAKGIAHLDSLPTGASLAEITEAMKDYGDIMAQGFGPGGEAFTAKLLANFQAVKSALWKDTELGKTLEAIAAGRPEIKAALPELNRLREGASEPFASLADMARQAGVSSPEALAEIAAADPWAPPRPKAPEAPGAAPDSEAPPETPKPGPEPGPEAAATAPVLHSRAEVESLLAAAREPDGSPGIFSGKVMQGLALAGLDFSGLAMSGARLTGSDLSGCAFRDCDLSGAALDGSRVGGADFSRALMAGADLSRVEGGPFTVAGADLTRADLTRADLAGVSFRGAKAPGAVFGGAMIPKDFAGADLSDASLSRWNGEGADFTGADLSGASFANVNLRQASFGEAVLPRCTFVTCDLSDADFRKAAASGVSFHLLSRATGTDFGGADLTGATFDLPEASGASFRGATGDRASFTGARLRGCSFQGASFREAVFSGADLRASDFHGADLMRAGFGGAQLAGAVFEGASLYAADFYLSRPDATTSFKGADLTNTVLVLDGEKVV